LPEGDISVEVENVVGLMYQAHKIVLGLADCPEGPEYRDFERQAGIETEIRGKPGESCHNFGLAVDLGFHELRWIAIKSWSGTKYVKPNEKQIVTDTWWLHGLADYAPDQAEVFWDERDQIAKELYAYPLTSERVHLQDFRADSKGMCKSLVDLLNRYGAMKWELTANKRFACDFGSGQKMFEVGTSQQIWDRQANVTKEMIANARKATNEALLARTTRVRWGGSIRPTLVALSPGSAHEIVPCKPGEVTHEDVVKMKEALKQDFRMAEKHWREWKKCW